LSIPAIETCAYKTKAVVGAICFWAIDKFVREARLANLLKLLVVLICLASILQRVLPLAGVNM
jgi:hypothetical protein